MRIQCRLLAGLLVLGLVFGLPVQAAQTSWIGGLDDAMAADGMTPAGDCDHCDRGATIDMAACHAYCFVMPVLLPRDAPTPMSLPAALPRERVFALFRGQDPAPDPGPPKLSVFL